MCSNGSFDIRRGGGIDPLGLVKGWSVERAATSLVRSGPATSSSTRAVTLSCEGGREPGRTWRLGYVIQSRPIASPRCSRFGDLAVATSGTYERGAHIVDPRSGSPPSGLLSLTVVGPSLTFADAYSTAAFVMGDRGAPWVTGIDGYDALAITTQRRTVWTPGLEALLVRGEEASV